MFGRDNLLENGQGRYRGERRSSSWSFRVRVRRLLEGSPGGRHPSVDYQPPLICYTTLEGTTAVFALPGVGSLAVDAVTTMDLPIVQGVVIFGVVVAIG